MPRVTGCRVLRSHHRPPVQSTTSLCVSIHKHYSLSSHRLVLTVLMIYTWAQTDFAGLFWAVPRFPPAVSMLLTITAVQSSFCWGSDSCRVARSAPFGCRDSLPAPQARDGRLTRFCPDSHLREQAAFVSGPRVLPRCPPSRSLSPLAGRRRYAPLQLESSRSLRSQRQWLPSPGSARKAVTHMTPASRVIGWPAPLCTSLSIRPLCRPLQRGAPTSRRAPRRR